MKKKKLLLISLLSGFVMMIAWLNTMQMGFFMLIGFLPLLYVEDYIAHNRQKFSSTAMFLYSYPAFLLFALPNTYWITNASIVALIVPFAESAFMAVVMQLYSYTKKVLDNKEGAYFILPLYWISFEYIQFTWDINFPWLNLGNSFASLPILVQWYSVLGMEGGTLWILLSNILIYLYIKKRFCFFGDSLSAKGLFGKKKEMIFALLIILVPIVWSIFLWNSYEDQKIKDINTVVVQPNLDPYEEQYSLSKEEVIQRVEYLSYPLIDNKVDYIILPESCIQEHAWESEMDEVASIVELKHFTAKYPNIEILSGMSSKKLLPKGVKTPAARKWHGSDDTLFERCNIAILFNSDTPDNVFQIHHKSILTVGVEKMPFKKYLSFVEGLALDLGGTVGTLGIDDTVVLFQSKEKGVKFASPICYESIDGNYVRKQVNKGAEVLFIVTNVGWWGDTPGYKQYFAISRLRAIENRRYVAISANTGFSGLVNARGEILDRTAYWTQDARKYSVPTLNNKTFFSSNGDIIMKPFCFFSILILGFSIITSRIRKQKSKKIVNK